jgi:RimJ/RimL family protein N-acetyltransferase
MHEIIRTERLRLRRFEHSDVDNLLELYTDPQVMQYLDNEEWTRQRIADELLPGFLAEYTQYQRFGYWAAETRPESGEPSFVGRIALHPVLMDPDPNRMWDHAPDDQADTVSIGYRICRRHWRQGYATEAANAIVELAFQQYGIGHAVATTMAVNRGSRRVLERVGFRHTRTVHLEWDDPLPGTEEGEVIYERWDGTDAGAGPDRSP